MQRRSRGRLIIGFFKKETYLAGAAAPDAFGRIASACGRTSGHSIRTGASLLAVVPDGSPRR
jgi:hypothetical protein